MSSLMILVCAGIVTAFMISGMVFTRVRPRVTDADTHVLYEASSDERLRTFEFRSSFRKRLKRIHINSHDRTVTFENCHRANRFLAWRADPLITCCFTEILEVHRSPTESGGITDILTSSGKATLSLNRRQEAAFQPVRDALAALSESNPDAAAIERPGFSIAAGFGFAVLMILAWLIFC